MNITSIPIPKTFLSYLVSASWMQKIHVHRSWNAKGEFVRN